MLLKVTVPQDMRLVFWFDSQISTIFENTDKEFTMTKKERLARQYLLQRIMKTMNVNLPEARARLAELEVFGLIKFDCTGRFYMRALED